MHSIQLTGVAVAAFAAFGGLFLFVSDADAQHDGAHDNPLDRVTRPPMEMVDTIVVNNDNANAQSGFDITITGLDALTGVQRAAFEDAEAQWESLITGYDISSGISGPTISARIEPIDGSGGTLGSAGPSRISIADGVIFALDGRMRFDSADVANLISEGTFGDVILHEMAHVLGFGTLWDNNSFAVDGSGEYTGLNAIEEFDSDFVTSPGGMVPMLGFVPVELGGGPGTSDSHWDESTDFEAADGSGPLANELMTGFLNTTPPGSPVFIADITLGQFRDLGFTTVATVPLEGDPLDFNGDQSVDIADLIEFINAFFDSGTLDPMLDFNQDQSVDIADLISYINAFFSTP